MQAKFNIGAGEVAVCGEARDAAIVDFRTGSANNKIVSQYQYNARGERVRKSDRFGTTQARYVYNEAGQLLVEQTISGSTTTTSEIVWLDNLPVGVIRNNILHYIEPDHLGTPRQVIDRTRDVVVWRWDLLNDPFGESAPNTNPDADGTHFVFNMRFPGQIHDAESGLNYNYFRDYEPGTGRYVASDPIGLDGGWSSYGYVSSDPLASIDPKGLEQWCGCSNGTIGPQCCGGDGDGCGRFLPCFSSICYRNAQHGFLTCMGNCEYLRQHDRGGRVGRMKRYVACVDICTAKFAAELLVCTLCKWD